MMRYYDIAGLCIAVDAPEWLSPMRNFEPFRRDPGAPDLLYTIRAYSPETLPVPPVSEMDCVSDDGINSLYLHGGMLYKCVAMQMGDPRRMWFAQRIGDRGEATVWLPGDWPEYENVGNAFSMEKTLLPFGGLMLHCSLIEWEGRGIAFTAPSQTGKSTQARLWSEHRGATILNGDRAILRVADGGIYAYGSPWAGSSDLYINRRVPLSAIVVLEQAKENRVRALPQQEALGLFLEGSSLPFWEPTLLEMGMQTLETILTRVPMALLSCLPDEGAVACLEGFLR